MAGGAASGLLHGRHEPGAVCGLCTCALKADRGMLTALRRLGVPWGTEDVVVQAVRHGCKLPVLRWLVEQGAPMGRAQDMEEAVGAVRGGGLSAEEAAWLRGLAGAAEALGSANGDSGNCGLNFAWRIV